MSHTSGVMNNIAGVMQGLVDQVGETDELAWKMNLTQMGIWGVAGAVKLVSFFGVATIPVGEAVFWGSTAAIATIPDVVGSVATAGSLSLKGALTKESYDSVGQLSSDIPMLTSLFGSATQYVLQPPSGSLLLLAAPAVTDALQFQSINLPSAMIASDANFAITNGSLSLKNNSTSSLSVSIHGSVTARLGSTTQIVGLLGSNHEL